MSFHVGQKVVCVDPVDDLVKGTIYTISGFGPFLGEILYDLAEIKTSIPHAWKGRRFRPVVERKTDIGFAHEILRKVTRKNRVRA